MLKLNSNISDVRLIKYAYFAITQLGLDVDYRVQKKQK